MNPMEFDMKLKFRHILFGLITVMGLGSMAFVWSTSGDQAVAANYQQLQKFSMVMETIRRNYVEKITDEAMIDGALTGMLASLDPHSTYMNKEMYKQIQVETKGEFGGLGIEISAAEGGIKVVAPIEDTPAYKAGIKAGDLIIKINDQLARDISLAEGVKLMRGKPGTSINLTIFREGEDTPLVFKIIRAVIKVKSVKSDVLAPGYAYLRITQFQERTDSLLAEAVRKLKDQSQGSLNGAVLDLRNNPGGLLNQAVAVSDLFLDKGGIVSTKSRTGSNLNFKAQPGDILDGVPMVVLINNGSASASEIVAGALKDNHRGVLVGSRSFGKGSVQTVIPLSDGSALKLTTALYYTPSGTSIQATGIAPDIHVEAMRAPTGEQKKRTIILERNLRGHLENGNKGGKDVKKKDSTDIVSEKMKKRLKLDIPLQRALDLLKGLHTLHIINGNG